MLFLALIYLIYITIGMPDAVLGASWPIMHAALGLPVSSAGFISLISSFGTIFASLFSYRAIRRYGSGRVVLVSILFMALALMGTAMSPSLIWLMLFALPLGLGVGAVDSGLNVYMAQHYQARHMNWFHCFWGIGAMAGPLLVSFLNSGGYGWQKTYSIFSFMQFALAGLLIFSLPAFKRREGGAVFQAQRGTGARVKKRILPLLRGKGARLAVLTFFLYTAIESNMMLWGASYLVEVKKLSPERAAGWIALLFLGITAGRFISGFVSIRLSNKTLVRSACILVVIGFLLLLIPRWDWLTITALIIIGLGFAPIFPSMMHETPNIFGQEDAQAAIGLQMAFAYIGNTLMPPVLGYFYTAVSFGWMPFVLLILAAALLGCTSYLFKMKKPEAASPH